MLSQQSPRCLGHRALGVRHLTFRPAHSSRVCSLPESRPSIDPLAQMPRPARAAPGIIYTAHTSEEVDAVLDEHMERLVVIMCKASHCKPCKTFMTKYQRMAELLPDSVLIDIMGDHSVNTKKLMLQWGVKSTPTFRMYRRGEVVGVVTGAKEAKVLPAVTELLLNGERGKELQPEDLEDASTDDD